MSDFENRNPENQAAESTENEARPQPPETAPVPEEPAASVPQPPAEPNPAPPAYRASTPRLTLEPDLEPDIPLPKAPEPEPASVQPPQWQAPPPPPAPSPRAGASQMPEPPYSAYPGQQAPPQYHPPQYSQQPVYAQPAYYPPQQYNVPPMGYAQKSRLAAGLLAILLGVFGAHNFYLGFKNRGAIQIIVALAGGLFTCGLATIGVLIWAFIEGVLLFSASPSYLYDGNGVILRD